MAWTSTVPLEKLQLEKRHKATVKDQEILLLWHDNLVYAIQSRCPHLKLPLVKGKITDNCAIICPFHKSEFDLKTGKVLNWSPWPLVLGKLLGKISKEKPLKTYPINIEDGMVLIDV